MPQIDGVNVTQAVYDDLYARRYETKKPMVRGLYSMFLALALLSLLARLYVRRLKRERFQRDDYAIILATAFYVFNSVVNILTTIVSDFGIHNIAAKPSTKTNGPIIDYIGNISYTLTWPMTKIALVLLYLRIFPQKWFRITCNVLLGIFTIYIIGTFFADVFACKPIGKGWKPSVDGKCINYTQLLLSTASANVGLDLILLFMVQIPIWQIRISLRQKIGISFVFGLGALACAASVVRVTIVLSFKQTDNPARWDGRWYVAANVWSNVELMLCILCATLPMCYPLLDGFRQKGRRILGRSRGSSSKTTSAESDNTPHANSVSHPYIKADESGLTPSGKSAKITTNARGVNGDHDKRFEDFPGEERGVKLHSIKVKSEIEQWKNDSER